MANFSRWLNRRGYSSKDVDLQTVQKYFRKRKGHQHPYRRNFAAQQMLELLRERDIGQHAGGIISTSKQNRIEEEFKHYQLQGRGLSEGTVKNHLFFVRRFLAHRFGQDRIHLSRLRATDITKFVLSEAHNLNFGCAKLLVSALRAFLRHLQLQGAIKDGLADCVPCVPDKALSTVPKFLRPGEVERVLTGCDRRTAEGRRDYAILLLLARLGLRGGEVAALKLNDVDWEHGHITVRGKGGTITQLPLPVDVGKAVVNYLRRGRPHCASPNIFVRFQPPLIGFAHASAISMIVRRALAQAEVDSPRKGAHLFRHTLATEMLKKGASLTEIGELLRHRHPNSTAIYTKVDLPALRKLALPWPGGVQ